MFWNLEMKVGGTTKFTSLCKRKVSESDLPETLIKTSNSLYLRFHGKDGKYQHFYGNKILKEWVEK